MLLTSDLKVDCHVFLKSTLNSASLPSKNLLLSSYDLS